MGLCKRERSTWVAKTYADHSSRWCGGTWRSIIDKLDYIQGMGMDAIWISPVASGWKAALTFHC